MYVTVLPVFSPVSLGCPDSSYSVKSWGKSGGKWEPGWDLATRKLAYSTLESARVAAMPPLVSDLAPH
jgi:hypothetical protein